jgi:menaquinone-dependent protoporphyrinogen oxidase
MKETTRREFIVRGSMIVGAAISGVGCSHVQSPNGARAGEVIFPEPSCGTDKGSQRPILVAYASFCGSTAGVAEAIAQAFCGKGAKVDVRLAKNVNSVEGYRAAVIGSAVRSASWWPEALSLVSRHERNLARMPVAYFLTCLTLYQDNPENRNTALGYFDPVLKASPGVKPVGMACFAGALDLSKMGFVYRTIMKSKMKQSGVPEGDFRNWPAIKTWAETAVERL